MKLQSVQTEVDASYLYDMLARHEEDPSLAAIFKQMSEIERGHALSFATRHQLSQLPGPSIRARIIKRIGEWFGYNYVLGVLLDTEKSLSNSIISAKRRRNQHVELADTAHVTILKNILNSSATVAVSNVARFEKRHRSVGGNALRAAVLGGNDGLVSNFSLVMGVAGALSGQNAVLLTGLAGLLAGALSMAMGEWISVRSSQELYENQMNLEQEEIAANPEGEEQELALIYLSKGIPEDRARELAHEIMKDKSQAHEVLVREELGINPEELKGSAMEAAITSFVLFAIGAIIPVVPFFFVNGIHAIAISAGLSALGLFAIGAAITLFTGRNVWYSGFRQVLFGLAAAAVTFGIGRLIGVSIGA